MSTTGLAAARSSTFMHGRGLTFKTVATRLAMSTTGYAYIHSSTFMHGRSLCFPKNQSKKR
ncbi:hypothetical protein [Nostoc sp.]|uniref:hypothetical protein n=1 Tax=Nostoc sp. TaxID=1180 RepID=UPI002FF63197